MGTMGARMVRLRAEHGWSIGEFAKRMGINYSTYQVSRWEKEREQPLHDDVPRIARAFGCTIDYLYTGEKPPAKRPKLVSHIAALHRAILTDQPHDRLVAMVRGTTDE